MLQTLGWALLSILAGTTSLVLALSIMGFVERRRRPRATSLEGRLEPTVFLFADDRLVDASGPARALLSRLGGTSDCQKLAGWIGAHFGDMPSLQEELSREGKAELLGNVGLGSARLRLRAERLSNGVLRIEIVDPQAESSGIVVDALSQNAMESELDILRRAVDGAPLMVWQQDTEGRITWANRMYLEEVESRAAGESLWPMPRLIEVDWPAGIELTAPRRAELDGKGDKRFFECYARPHERGMMVFAMPADAEVRAEQSLREFVQTLTKTFAGLPIGLAIFDRERHLQLFNPALIDLTSLPTGFLTGRPTLYGFLDRLREARMVPEPKDYRSWRRQIANLESAAATGLHVDIWSLPNGQTYRVTGRPHPDGAVAFLFEDISAEMARTREYREELSLSALLLDSLEEAVALFGPDGKLLLSNRAYAEMWGEPSATLAQALRIWRIRNGETPAYAKLREHLEAATQGMSATSVGQGRSGLIMDRSGELLNWQVRPIHGTRVMVRFSTDLPAPGQRSDSGAARTGTDDASGDPRRIAG